MRYTLILLFVLASCSLDIAFEERIPYEEGSIEVSFCPHNCNKTLYEIYSTTTRMDCAFYDLDANALPLIDEAQVLIFKKNYEDFGTPISSRALMHDKFCLLDNDLFWTGSMNPTHNGIFKNNNNLLVIDSACVKSNFEREFIELQSKHEEGLPCPKVNLSGSIVETYFCPENNCKGALLKTLSSAQESIHFMTFSFTLQEAADVLIAKHKSGLNISGVFEARQKSYSVHDQLMDAGVNVHWDGNKNTMHHKTFIIDEKIVITGSMNPSKNGVGRNDENLLIIHDEDIAQQFMDEFEHVKAEALNKVQIHQN